jgi:cell division septation protein DedD
MKLLLTTTSIVMALILTASADWRKDALEDIRKQKKASPQQSEPQVQPQPQQTAPAATAAPALAQRSKEDCTARLSIAEKAGVISGFRMEDKTTPTLIVDENTWNKIEFSVKLGMAETTVCALLGPGESLPYPLKLLFRSNRTNRIIGEYSGGDLVVK